MATAEEIRNYAASQGYKPNAQGRYEVNGDNDAFRIYSHAASKGYSGSDLDSAFGWNAGDADAWIGSKGLKALGGATTPAANPAGSTTTGATTGATTTTTGATSAPQPATPPPNDGAAATSIMGRAMSSARGEVGQTPGQPYQGIDSRYGQAAQTQWREDMSSAGRLNSMLQAGGPLMETARLRGNQQAAARGLLSSSMGVEAAQKAMIESATPFATTDAGLYAQMARENTSQANAWDVADLNRQQSDKQFGANLAENARQADLGASTQLTVAGMTYDINDRRLNQEDRQFLETFGLEQRKLDTQISQFAQEFGLSVEELGIRRDQLTQQDRQFYDELILQRDELDQRADQFTQEWENRFSLEAMAQANRIDLAKLDVDSRKELMEIEATYKKDIAANENIGNAWGLMMQEIGKINANPDMDKGTKATNIDNTIGAFKNFTVFWKKAGSGDIDVSDLLDFGVNAAMPTSSSSTSGPASDDYVDQSGINSGP
jgi:hypothetical protein